MHSKETWKFCVNTVVIERQITQPNMGTVSRQILNLSNLAIKIFTPFLVSFRNKLRHFETLYSQKNKKKHHVFFFIVVNTRCRCCQHIHRIYHKN